MAGRTGLAVVAGVAALALAGCALEEITLIEAEDVVVAEVYLQVGDPASSSLRAFLHRTLGTGPEAFRPEPGARIVVSRSDGLSVELAETPVERCVETLPVGGDGTCYWAAPEATSRLGPGDRLELEISLAGGGTIQGAATVPSDFELVGIPVGSTCRLEPDTPLELRWSRSDGAWVYVNETLIRGLGAALAPEGIEVEDPLYLLGVSIAAADTSIVFPGEFGVFNRFELDQALALRLQEGLPIGASAEVTIAAADRNYANWVRGGSFNPSGLVRLPSLRGDGTGVFGAIRKRDFRIVVGDAAVPACPTF